MSKREVMALLHEILHVELLAVGNFKLTLAALLLFLVMSVLTYRLSSLVQRAIEKAMVARGTDDVGSIAVARRLAHYVVLLVGFGVALQSVGFDLSALFAAGAVFAVGLGFAMQTLAENFVSGILLLLERTIVPGDVLELDGKTVRVEQMNIRTTLVRGLDDEEIIVPNSSLVKNAIKSFTHSTPHTRLRVVYPISYKADMTRVREVMMQTAQDFADRDPTRAPVLQLIEVGSSALMWEVSIWIQDPMRRPAIRATLQEVLWHALKEAGIEIPYPQLDVHIQGVSHQGEVHEHV